MMFPITIHYGASKTITDANGEVFDCYTATPEEFHEVRRSLVRTYKIRNQRRKGRKPQRHGRQRQKKKA